MEGLQGRNSLQSQRPNRHSYLMLDVGSGPRPKGDVNCDLFVGYSPHSTLGPVRKTVLFVKCDAMHLPFRDKTFDIVHCSHVLEHLTSPRQALKDFKRVVKRLVYLRVPNQITRFREQRPEHLYAWDKPTFRHFLLTIFDDVTVCQSGFCEVIHGRRVDRMQILKRLLNTTVSRLIPNELVAICKVEAQ